LAAVAVSRSMLVYRHRMPGRDAPRKRELEAVAAEQPAWGDRLAAGVLRERGLPVSDKRAHRVWRNADSPRAAVSAASFLPWRALRPCPRRRMRCGAWTSPRKGIVNGRKFWTLLIKDKASAFCVAAPVSLSFKGADAVRVLTQATARYGRPAYLRGDHGGQFIAKAVRRWAERERIRIAYIDPGNPWQNGAAESLVATFRREVLDAELFHSLLEAHVAPRAVAQGLQRTTATQPARLPAADRGLPSGEAGHRIAS